MICHDARAPIGSSCICCMRRYAKLVLCNGRVQGALFVSLGDGEHDVETFENLILSQAKFLCLFARVPSGIVVV